MSASLKDTDRPDTPAPAGEIVIVQSQPVPVPKSEQPSCALTLVGCASGKTYCSGPPVAPGSNDLDLRKTLMLLIAGLEIVFSKLPVPDEQKSLIQKVGAINLPPFPGSRRDA